MSGQQLNTLGQVSLILLVYLIICFVIWKRVWFNSYGGKFLNTLLTHLFSHSRATNRQEYQHPGDEQAAALRKNENIRHLQTHVSVNCLQTGDGVLGAALRAGRLPLSAFPEVDAETSDLPFSDNGCVCRSC